MSKTTLSSVKCLVEFVFITGYSLFIHLKNNLKHYLLYVSMRRDSLFAVNSGRTLTLRSLAITQAAQGTSNYKL